MQVATTIRLTRMGKKKRPFYRLVVLDSRVRRDGAYLANLGHYNPFVEPAEVKLHAAEILDWLGKGATVSDSARSLLKREGVLYHFSLLKKGLSAEDIAAKMEAWRPTADARMLRTVSDRRSHLQHVEAAEQKRRDDKETAKKDAAAAAAAPAPVEDAPAPEGETS
jgi:small subunit ribosomal protein S16